MLEDDTRVGGQTLEEAVQSFRISQEEAYLQFKKRKKEDEMVVEKSIEELCNVLHLSGRLRKMIIHFPCLCDGLLRTDREHFGLKRFAFLQNVPNVTTTGVSDVFASSLARMMRAENA